MFNTFPRKGKTDFYVRKKDKQFNETLQQTGINTLVPVFSLEPKNPIDKPNGISFYDLDVAILSTGTGALLRQVPEGTDIGGDKRGYYAVDLQVSRSLASDVASGSRSAICGGSSNAATGDYSFVGAGSGNKNAGYKSAIAAGYNNSIQISCQYSGIFGGTGNILFDSAYKSGIFISSSSELHGDFSVILGGSINYCAQSQNGYNFIGGGYNNSLTSDYAFIGGGAANSINSGSDYSFLGSGYGNSLTGSRCFLGEGYTNSITGGDVCFLGGGWNNSLVNAKRSVIVGGYANLVSGTVYHSFIGGGSNNKEYSGTNTIPGGSSNTINLGSDYACIGGGSANSVNNPSPYGTIAGGRSNSLYGNSSAIGGGYLNSIASSAAFCVISGGQSNIISASKTYSSIGGGRSNTISGLYGRIGGGYLNDISSGSDYCYIGGGYDNNILSSVNYSSILGGYINNLSGNYSTILSGNTNSLTGDYSAILNGSGISSGGINCTFSGYNIRPLKQYGGVAFPNADYKAGTFTTLLAGGQIDQQKIDLLLYMPASTAANPVFKVNSTTTAVIYVEDGQLLSIEGSILVTCSDGTYALLKVQGVLGYFGTTINTCVSSIIENTTLLTPTFSATAYGGITGAEAFDFRWDKAVTTETYAAHAALRINQSYFP